MIADAAKPVHAPNKLGKKLYVIVTEPEVPPAPSKVKVEADVPFVFTFPTMLYCVPS